MKKRKNIITVAIDSPAAAGAGTQAKLISQHYNLYHLDTGKIYRFIGFLRLVNQKNFNYTLIRKKIRNLKIKNLKNRNLLSDEVAVSAVALKATEAEGSKADYSIMIGSDAGTLSEIKQVTIKK